MPNNVTDTQPLDNAGDAQATAAPQALDTGKALDAMPTDAMPTGAAPTDAAPSGGSGGLLGGLLGGGGGGGSIPGTTRASFLGMGLPIPTFLIKAAAALGFKWPESDEMELFRIGKNYIASGIEYMKIRGEVDEAIKELLSNNESDGLDAFDRFQRRLTSLAGSHMMISGTSAPAIGVAYLAAGGLVLALKVHAIMILIEAAITMAMQAFGAVLGPLGVGALAAKLAALRAQLEGAIRAVETAMKPVLKVAEQVISIYTKVATPMLKNRPMNKNTSTPALTPGPGGGQNGNLTPGTPLAANNAQNANSTVLTPGNNGGQTTGQEASWTHVPTNEGNQGIQDAQGNQDTQGDRGRADAGEQAAPAQEEIAPARQSYLATSTTAQDTTTSQDTTTQPAASTTQPAASTTQPAASTTQPAASPAPQGTASDADAWDSVIDPADQPSRNLKVPTAPPRAELAPGATRG